MGAVGEDPDAGEVPGQREAHHRRHAHREDRPQRQAHLCGSKHSKVNLFETFV